MTHDSSYQIISAKSHATAITFTDQDTQQVVFTIKPGGVLEAGPGLSDDEATRSLFASMVRIFPDLMRYLALAG